MTTFQHSIDAHTSINEDTLTGCDTSTDVSTPRTAFAATSHKALVITAFHESLSIASIPIPEVGEHDVLVRNRAIGLNPIDWKGKKYRFAIYDFPWVNGRESSGDVVHVGSKVTDFQHSDKVIVSSTSYRDNRTSTFQEYTALDSRLVWKLPPFLSYEDGATIGVGLVTAGVILYQSFGFLLSSTAPKPSGNIFIWGGSTVVGIYIIQLANILGLNVIVVASLGYEDYLKEIGADQVIDRFLEPEQILSQIGDLSLDYGVDCVSKETSQAVLKILSESNRTTGKKLYFAGIVGLPKQFPENVELRETVIKKFHEDVAFGKEFVKVTTEYLHHKQIKPAKVKSYSGGLDSIQTGLVDLEVIGARAEKYVVSI